MMKDENESEAVQKGAGEENREWEGDDAFAPYPEEQPKSGPQRRQRTRLLTSIQIYTCLAVLAAALLLRLHGGEMYAAVRSWYLGALNDSLIAEEQLDQAKRTVVGLWTWISSAGPQTGSASGTISSMPSTPGSSGASGASSAPSAASSAPAGGEKGKTP